VSRFLTAQQRNLGNLVPFKVKSEKRESNHKTMLKHFKGSRAFTCSHSWSLPVTWQRCKFANALSAR